LPSFDPVGGAGETQGRRLTLLTPCRINGA
jgi:hypothetical protein